ncbi:MAG: nuclear transport factor 2 family protein [Candidatus Delongbacteria bacterium]|nr:nuclear transport factor 2 family protein [Candidatus Delongbacteria bacterium]
MVTNYSIKLFFLLFLILLSNGVIGQYATKIFITDLEDTKLAKSLETNSSNLLTKFNHSFFKKTTPYLDSLNIEKKAISSVLSLWETSIFRCLETELILRCVNKPGGGYEIRNIPIYMVEADSMDRFQEAVINFDSKGRIIDFYISLEAHQVSNILSNSISVTEFRRRQIILDFIENFRTAYNRKDIQFLKNVYSDDALIISGKVIKTKPGDDRIYNMSSEKIIYTKQTKSEYLGKLDRIFKTNSYINIKFDEIEIQQSKKYPEIYGVTLKQYWNTSRYSDIGYLFLMIDFSDENNPIIHVRTWQPDKYPNGTELSKDELFNLGMFNIKK